MKSPTIQFGKYRIRYRQIPYVNRFFFVDIKDRFGRWNKEFMKIESFHTKYDLHLREIFGFLFSELVCGYNFTAETAGRLNRFMEQVRQYDDYLDDKE